jgi:ligand-binding sensor domain-containing protein
MITLEIPVGKIVYIDSSMHNLIYDIENVQNMWDEDMIGKKWIMTSEGLSHYKDDTKKIEQNDDIIEGVDSLNMNADTAEVSNEISI